MSKLFISYWSNSCVKKSYLIWKKIFLCQQPIVSKISGTEKNGRAAASAKRWEYWKILIEVLKRFIWNTNGYTWVNVKWGDAVWICRVAGVGGWGRWVKVSGVSFHICITPWILACSYFSISINKSCKYNNGFLCKRQVVYESNLFTQSLKH